jgi:hypothetical protein
MGARAILNVVSSHDDRFSIAQAAVHSSPVGVLSLARRILWPRSRLCRAMAIPVVLCGFVFALPAFAFDGDPDGDEFGDFAVSGAAVPDGQPAGPDVQLPAAGVRELCPVSAALPTFAAISSRRPLLSPRHSRSSVFRRTVSNGL